LVSVSPPASATSPMTTKLPRRRDSRRAHRPVPETCSPLRHGSAYRRRSSLNTTPLHAAVYINTPPRISARSLLSDERRSSLATPGSPAASQTGSVQTLPARRPAFGYQRSMSLTEDKVITGVKSAHRIDFKSVSSSDSTLSPSSSNSTSCTREDLLASPPLHRAPSPPPPLLPPRVPLRPPTSRQPHRPRLPARQRSMSEAEQSAQTGTGGAGGGSVSLVLPRRAARSTSDAADTTRSSAAAVGSEHSLDGDRDYDDCVFGDSSSSNDDKHVRSLSLSLSLYLSVCLSVCLSLSVSLLPSLHLSPF